MNRRNTFLKGLKHLKKEPKINFVAEELNNWHEEHISTGNKADHM